MNEMNSDKSSETHKDTPWYRKRFSKMAVGALAVCGGAGLLLGATGVSGSWVASTGLSGDQVTSGDLQIIKGETTGYVSSSYSPKTNNPYIEEPGERGENYVRSDSAIVSSSVAPKPIWLSDFKTVREGDRLDTAVTSEFMFTKELPHSYTSCFMFEDADGYPFKYWVYDKLDRPNEFPGDSFARADGVIKAGATYEDDAPVESLGHWEIDTESASFKSVCSEDRPGFDPITVDELNSLSWKFVANGDANAAYEKNGKFIPPKGEHEYTAYIHTPEGIEYDAYESARNNDDYNIVPYVEMKLSHDQVIGGNA